MNENLCSDDDPSIEEDDDDDDETHTRSMSSDYCAGLQGQTSHTSVWKRISTAVRPSATLRDQPVTDRTIVLLGTTGSGKSTLGNYLLDPALNSKRAQSARAGDKLLPSLAHSSAGFRTATDNTPCTNKVTVRSRVHTDSNILLKIVDTPGMNESAIADLSHMIDIVKSLREFRQINACILCVRFSAKLDIQYRSTLEYYRDMLPTLFHNYCVIIVFTSYSQHPYEVAKREQEGINSQKVIDNALEFIVKHAKLSHEPEWFCIDSRPFMPEDHVLNGTIRETILARIAAFSWPIETDSLLVAKTPKLVNLHALKAERLTGEISGYNNRLRELNQQADTDLRITEVKNDRLVQLRALIDDANKEYNALNTEELIPLAKWQSKVEWSFSGAKKERFNLQSKWTAKDYVTWDNGHLNWTNVVFKDNSISGKVTGEFWRGLYYSVTLLGEKRNRYAEKIKVLLARLKEYTEEQELLNKELAQCRAGKFKEEIETLEKFIEERQKEKLRFLASTMTIQEADYYLKDLEAGDE